MFLQAQGDERQGANKPAGGLLICHSHSEKFVFISGLRQNEVNLFSYGNTNCLQGWKIRSVSSGYYFASPMPSYCMCKTHGKPDNHIDAYTYTLDFIALFVHDLFI